MRALGALVLVTVLLSGCGDGSSATAARVKALMESQKFDKALRDVSCREGEHFRMPEGISGWRCALVFSDGSKGSCDAFAQKHQVTVSFCRGVVLPPPSLAEVERQMVSGSDGATRAICHPDGPRKWSCKLVFRDRPDESGTYQASPDGMSSVTMSSSGSSLSSPAVP